MNGAALLVGIPRIPQGTRFAYRLNGQGGSAMCDGLTDKGAT